MSRNIAHARPAAFLKNRGPDPATVQDDIRTLQARATAVEAVIPRMPNWGGHCQPPRQGIDPQLQRHQVLELPAARPVVTAYQVYQFVYLALGGRLLFANSHVTHKIVHIHMHLQQVLRRQAGKFKLSFPFEVAEFNYVLQGTCAMMVLSRPQQGP